MAQCRVGVSPCRNASGALRRNRTQLVHIPQVCCGSQHWAELSPPTCWCTQQWVLHTGGSVTLQIRTADRKTTTPALLFSSANTATFHFLLILTPSWNQGQIQAGKAELLVPSPFSLMGLWNVISLNSRLWCGQVKWSCMYTGTFPSRFCKTNLILSEMTTLPVLLSCVVMCLEAF